MNKEVVKELIQDELTTKNLIHELNLLINSHDKIHELKKNYQQLIAVLSAGGNASEKAAAAIIEVATS